MKGYTEIYKLLCRDANRPFTDGLDIPVFMRTGCDEDTESILDIDIDASEKTIALLLVDDYMYCSRKWGEYIDTLVKTQNGRSEAFRIIGISLCRNAFDIHPELSKKQFISFASHNLFEPDNWKEFQLRIQDNIVRFLNNDDEKYKLKLFISHSKRDTDKYGVTIASDLRDYIRSKTKLDFFFDANDIIDGYSFADQIKENAERERTTLVIINSDTYSEREWCQKEVLYAKQTMRPAIVVNVLHGTVARSFPYISNIPHIQFNGDWSEVLILALRTTLDYLYQSHYLNWLKKTLPQDERDKYSILPFAPEAYSFTYDELSKRVIYPEPPLYKNELDVLLKISQNGDTEKFLTPMQLLSDGIDLTGKNIAVSVSESPDAIRMGIGECMFRDFIVEISRHLLVAGAHLTYGGDLRNGGYTHLFKELSYQYGEYQHNSNRNTKYFTNYFAWPIHTNLTIQEQSEFERSRVEIALIDPPEDFTGDKNAFLRPVDNESNLIWAQSLLKMRRAMEAHVDARIILGGRLHGFKGFMAGLFEEFHIASSHNHPIYVIGGFGGVSGVLASLLEKTTNVEAVKRNAFKDGAYRSFSDFCYRKGISQGYEILQSVIDKGVEGLNNGLSVDENIRLFQTTNIIEIISLILKGLKNVTQQ